MHITTPSFKKAAKRLAAKHSFALNAAQESLAEAFGFANFDAALKALESVPRPASTPAAESIGAMQSDWLGLTGPQVVALITAIALPRIDTDPWQERSLKLLRIIVRDQFRIHAGRPLHAAALGHALQRQVIESRCWTWESAGLPKPASDIEGYLTTLPAYRKERYQDQLAEAVEHHAHLQAPLAFAVSRMESLEAPGALNDVELKNLGRLAVSAADGERLAVDALRALVERCEFA